MAIQHHPDFEDQSTIRYIGASDDGASTIVCGPAYADGISRFLIEGGVAAGVDNESPQIQQCVVIVTSSMSDPETVKELLRTWMRQTGLGDPSGF